MLSYTASFPLWVGKFFLLRWFAMWQASPTPAAHLQISQVKHGLRIAKSWAMHLSAQKQLGSPELSKRNTEIKKTSKRHSISTGWNLGNQASAEQPAGWQVSPKAEQQLHKQGAWQGGSLMYRTCSLMQAKKPTDQMQLRLLNSEELRLCQEQEKQ